MIERYVLHLDVDYFYIIFILLFILCSFWCENDLDIFGLCGENLGAVVQTKTRRKDALWLTVYSIAVYEKSRHA